MIAISNFSFKFDEKTIINNTEFTAENGALTLLLGKSGSGKSTILNIIAGEITYPGYTIPNEMKYLKQNPLFIDDLKMKEHIELIEKIISCSDSSGILQQLQLGPTLNNYPNQLSGGEKLRWGLYLLLLQSPKVLLCDEPTASLDWYQKEQVMMILQNYAARGNTVIVASHDKDFNHYANKIYRIQDQKLILEKDGTSFKVEPPSTHKSLSTNHIITTLKKMFFHHKTANVLTKFALICSIIFCSCIYKFDEKILSANEYKLNENIRNELLIYRYAGGKIGEDFSYIGYETPFSQEEIDMVLETPHIADYSYRYDFHYSLRSDNPMNTGILSDVDAWPMIIVDQNGNEIEISVKSEDMVNYHSYDNNHISDIDVKHQYHEVNGIYLDQNMNHYLLNQTQLDNLDGCRIKFILTYPTYSYNAGGFSYDDGPFYSTYSLAGDLIEVELPISGILSGSQFGILNPGTRDSFSNNFYFPYQMIDDISNEHSYSKDHQLFTVYHDREAYSYIDSVPETVNKDEIIGVINFTKWGPDSLIVQLDSIVYSSDVISSLKDKGFGVISLTNQENYNPFILNLYKDSFNSIMLGLFITILLIYAISQYLLRNKVMVVRTYLDSIYHQKETVQRIMVKYYLSNALFLFGASILVTFGLLLYISSTTYFTLEISDIGIMAIALLLCIVYEVIIPLLIGGISHD